ncbi:MAG TPA: hypothetical protein DD653_17790 [Marinilabiliales bacterium]|nr:MAG: hypothetical protein A2W84_05295 [Bacteroidetes bacterium GWC2_40_13]HBO76515.1 hypothetical protein [Marinilabiliales bacterium]
MKKLVLIFMAFLPILAMAQESKLNQLFDKYSGQEGYTSVYITSYMFELFSKLDDESDAEFENMTKGLEAIKILTVSDGLDAKSRELFYQEISSATQQPVYKDFMIVKDGKQEVIFKVREDGKKITEFVMVVKDASEPVLMFLLGDIDLKQISKMSKTMDIKGFEHLEKVEEKQ